MRYLVMGVAVLAVTVVGDRVWAQVVTNGVNPPGNERRSMGNLRPNTTVQPPVSNGSVGRDSAGFTHRRWGYGKAPYYRRPPTTPYYVVPQYSPYNYGHYYVPWNGRPYYVPPGGGYYAPYANRYYR